MRMSIMGQQAAMLYTLSLLTMITSIVYTNRPNEVATYGKDSVVKLMHGLFMHRTIQPVQMPSSLSRLGSIGKHTAGHGVKNSFECQTSCEACAETRTHLVSILAAFGWV